MIKRCKCGCPIWIESVWNGIRYFLRYFDSITGREITHCPDCGEWLVPEVFESPAK